jgi:hypothetical protein
MDRQRRAPPIRHLLWLLVAIVLLKAATPLFASLAASIRGVPLVEVCTSYGVRMVAMGTEAGDPSVPAHHGDQADCALSPLLSSAPLAARSVVVPTRAAQASLPPCLVVATAHGGDAMRCWLSRRMHAPPVLV